MSRLETNAKKFRRFVLLQHQRSDCHKNSVRVLLGQEPQTKPIKRESGTPSIERFVDILQAIRKHQFSALRRGLGGFGHIKTRKMVWCLAESLKQLYRNQLRQACTINILRDERNKRLQFSWRTCNSKMSLNRGGFGIIKSHDSGACGNAEGTRKLIENFCTKFYDPPDAPKSCAEPTLDVSLLRHIRNVTEAITIDAASCEVASARDLTSSSSFTAEQIAQPFMPNLLPILRAPMWESSMQFIRKRKMLCAWILFIHLRTDRWSCHRGSVSDLCTTKLR